MDNGKLLAVAVLLGASLWNVKRIIENKLPTLKEGVNLDDLDQNMDRALLAIARAADFVGAPNVVTSGRDGVHSRGSLHYVGKALDARRVDWPKFADAKSAEEHRRIIAVDLGDDFDVVLEPTHIHIEFDPKRVA